MSKKHLLIIPVVAMGILTGCEKEPEAGFTYDAEDLVAQNEIQFTNTSTNADSYEWTFGDGSDTIELNFVTTETGMVLSVTNEDDYPGKFHASPLKFIKSDK